MNIYVYEARRERPLNDEGTTREGKRGCYVAYAKCERTFFSLGGLCVASGEGGGSSGLS